MRRRRIFLAAALALVAVGSGCIFLPGNLPFGRRGPLEEKTLKGKGRDKVLLLDISRVITGQEHKGPLGLRTRESTVARLEEELRKAGSDRRVRALVLRINSPGGSVTASDTIYRELRRFREKHDVPIVAALGEVAASGGYYVALAADEIVAQPTTVTGSIGVIMLRLDLSGLLGKIGVRDETQKAGEKKDLLSPLRPPTPAERAIIQSILDDLHARFVSLVAKRRPQVSRDQLATIADGRILSAVQAKQAGLVDRVGYLDEAIARARKLAGLKKARVVTYRRPDEYRENIYFRAGPPLGPASVLPPSLAGLLSASGPQFMYLWAPGLGGD